MFHAKKYGARMYTAEFSGHKHYGNGDMMILVCHLTIGLVALWVKVPQDKTPP